MLVCRTTTRRCHIPEYISPAGSYFRRTAAGRSGSLFEKRSDSRYRRPDDAQRPGMPGMQRDK